MAKEAVFTLKLEPELRDAFMAAAKVADRPASQIVREFMRDYVKQDRDYVTWLQRKVDAARAEVADGKTHSDEEVRAHMEALYKRLEQEGREAAE